MMAAIMVGNWFLAILKENKAQNGPWYKPYLSPPGVIILLAVMFPLFMRWFQ